MEKKRLIGMMLFSYCLISSFNLNNCFAQDSNKYGFIDKAGEIVIKPRFDQLYPFSDGLAAAMIGKQWGYINKEGKFTIDLQYTWVSSFDEGKAMVCVDDEENFKEGVRCGCIDKKGKVVVNLSNGFYDLGQSLLKGVIKPFRDDESMKFGYKDENKKIVIEPKYEEAYPFSEGLALVCNADSKCGYIDETGKMVIEPQYQTPHIGGCSFNKGLAIVCNDAEKYGVINKKGNLVVNFLFDYISPYSEGLASIEVGKAGNGKYGVIDTNGNVVIEPKFELIENFSEGLAAFKDSESGKWGYIDTTGKIVIPAQFSDAGPFSEGLAKVEQSNRWGFIDKTGKIVIEFKFDFVSSFSGGLAIFGPPPRY